MPRSCRRIDFAASRAALTERHRRRRNERRTLSSPPSALLDALQAIAQRRSEPRSTGAAPCPQNSSWWFVLDRFFSRDPNLAAAYITPTEDALHLRGEGAAPRRHRGRAGARCTSPAGATRCRTSSRGRRASSPSSPRSWSSSMCCCSSSSTAAPSRSSSSCSSLALSIGALVTSLKLFGIPLNMFNVLAFPLVLGVGVDYGIYVVIAMRQEGDRQRNLATVVKPVLLSGLTTTCGFGSLGLRGNPALRSLGVVCALGVAWCALLHALLCPAGLRLAGREIASRHARFPLHPRRFQAGLRHRASAAARLVASGSRRASASPLMRAAPKRRPPCAPISASSPD